MRIIQKLCFIVVLLTLTGCGDKAEKAKQQLAAQSIAFTEEDFIEQITKGDAGIIDLFFTAGMQPVVKNKAGTPAIVAAVAGKNPQIIQMMIDRIPAGQGESAPINQTDAKGRSALSLAAEQGDNSLINTLNTKGGSAFSMDSEQYTPLHFSVLKNKIETAQLLIQLDASANQDQKPRALNFSNNNAETPLLIAVRNKNAEMVKLLLSQGASPDIADRRGYTPLMAAVEMDVPQIAEWLIDAKARIDLYDAGGMSPLKFAIAKSNSAMVDFLIKKGADPDFARDGDKLPIEIVLTAKPFDLELFNYLNKISKKSDLVASSLLFDAVDNNQIDVVKILLARGMDANSKDADGKTLLYKTLEKGYGDIAALLIEKGADPQTAVGTLPPLELAVRANMKVVVKKLLDAGANPDVRTNEGYTLTEVCVYKGYPEVLEMLMEKGAGIKLDYAILWSIIDGKGLAVPVLLKYGANPNVLSQQGDPALWLAVSSSQEVAVEALLKYKAFPNVISQTLGSSALGLAAYVGNVKIIKLLIDAGAQTDMPDKSGVTPLGYAASQAHIDAISYLLEKGADPKHIDKYGRSIQDLVNSSPVSGDKKEKVSILLRKINTIKKDETPSNVPKAPATSSASPSAIPAN